MPDVLIENPILNSPYDEPRRHFVFSDDGITGEIADTRRVSSYFIPIPPPKRRGGQQILPGDWLGERIKSNEFINRVRERVSVWRQGGYVGVTPITRSLIDYWRNPERERPLFFCQIEALETVIYVSEVANRYGDAWIENRLREENEASNPGLFRVALKMATGSEIHSYRCRLHQEGQPGKSAKVLIRCERNPIGASPPYLIGRRSPMLSITTPYRFLSSGR